MLASAGMKTRFTTHTPCSLKSISQTYIIVVCCCCCYEYYCYDCVGGSIAVPKMCFFMQYIYIYICMFLLDLLVESIDLVVSFTEAALESIILAVL